MKNNIGKKLAVFCVLVFLLASCSIESSDNGSLDGFWHLERVDTLSTGGSCDLSESKLFWGVQHKLISLNGGSLSFFYRFSQTRDSLLLLVPYVNRGHEDVENGGDILVSNPEDLRQYGIQHVEEHFLKETLSGSRMVLRTDSIRLWFKKF